MPEINAKFIAVIIVAAIILGTGLSLFHETYNAKPYEKIKIPQIFENEQKMLAFSTKGSSMSPVQNGTIQLHGYIKNKSGNPVTGRISIYDFPWVVYTDLNSQGYYNVTLLQYGSFTIGYKVSGYNTGFSKFTILSGNSKWENLTLQKATFYNVSGKTFNLTGANVPNVNLSFISFFGFYNSSSNSNAVYHTVLQNGTYAALTIKRNYNETPKPLFFNVTGKEITNLNFKMRNLKNETYLISGYIRNKLNLPAPLIKVSSVSLSHNSTAGSFSTPSFFASTLTNKSGYYQVSAPVGVDYIYVSTNYEYLFNFSSPFFVNRSVGNINISVNARDPFVSPTVINSINYSGIKPIPSFMESNVSSYLKSSLSDVSYNLAFSDFNKGFIKNRNITIQLNNIFYPNSPQNRTLLHSLNVLIMGNFEGTIYYRQTNISTSGVATFPAYYFGSYNLVVYAPGFLYSTVSISIKNQSGQPVVPDISLKPLPGQVFEVSGFTFNLINQQRLLFPDITLNENGLLVNSSIEQSSGGSFKFYYFIDTHQNYEINLTINVFQAGFYNSSKSFVIKSISGQKNFTSIQIGSRPLNSIGSGFTESLLRVPGYNKTHLENILKGSVSSNIYNKGPQKISVRVSNFSKNKGNEFVVYSNINGLIYSKKVFINSTVNPTFNISTTFSLFMNISLFGQYYKTINNPVSDGISQTVSTHFAGRQTSVVNISLVNMLNFTVNKDFGLEYGREFNEQLPVSDLSLNISSSSIPIITNSVNEKFNGTFITYKLPQGSYNFTYRGQDYVSANLKFNHNNKTGQFKKLNVSSYGLVIPIESKVKVSFYVAETTFQNNSLLQYTVPPGVNGKMLILNQINNLTGVKMDYHINVEGSNFTSKSFSLNFKTPYNVQYINVTNTRERAIFNETGSRFANKTYLWNNSVNLGSISGIIKNVTVELNNQEAYYMQKYSRLEIDGKNISILSIGGSEFNNLSYSYIGGQKLGIDIYLGGSIYSIYAYFYVYFGILNVNYANMNGVE